MLRKLTAGLLAIGAMGFAGGAMAVDTSTSTVDVNIEVAPEVSMWPDHTNVSLVLEGNNAENSDVFESGLSYINNVDAKIDVMVAGTLPTPIVPGGGINFFIFDEIDGPTATANMVPNAYNPAGALAWNQGSLGTSQELTPAVGVNTSIHHRLITYAADAPGELPLPDNFALVVTWTLTEN